MVCECCLDVRMSVESLKNVFLLVLLGVNFGKTISLLRTSIFFL